MRLGRFTEANEAFSLILESNSGSITGTCDVGEEEEKEKEKDPGLRPSTGIHSIRIFEAI